MATEADEPQLIPSVELTGSTSDRLRQLDSAIAQLHQLRSALAPDLTELAPPAEIQGRYINAPVWPWFAAGCVIGAAIVLMFVVAWTLA